MIKVTIEEILNAVPALRVLKEQNFDGMTAFKIARMLREVNKEVELFEQERYKLIEKFCIRNENGNIIEDNGEVKIDPEHVEDFNNEIREMLSNEVEINAVPLSLNTLENLTITPEQAFSLEKFFEE